jgi:hypothetical protein
VAEERATPVIRAGAASLSFEDVVILDGFFAVIQGIIIKQVSLFGDAEAF